MQLSVRRYPGRAGELTLLLLHGLGANGAVWDRFVNALAGKWNGSILIPDLSGHGKSSGARDYALGRHAADIADLLSADEPVCVIGHSMGGAIGVLLASGWFGVDVRDVLALSVKPTFSAADIERARAFAAKPPRYFATQQEAVERFLQTSGLSGIVAPTDAVVFDGVRRVDDGYTLAADPRSVLVAGPSLKSMLEAAVAPVHLATGQRDEIATAADLRSIDTNVAVVADAGHNVHVERPDAVVELFMHKTFVSRDKP